MTKFFIQNLLFVTVAIVICGRALAQSTPNGWTAPQSTEELRVFAEQYLSLEITRNFPMSFAQNRFEPGQPHPSLGYRHRFKQNWLMGIGAQFRILQRRDVPENAGNTGSLSIWTIYHETNYALRLDHPNYLLIGPRIMYLLPGKSAVLPLQRDPVLQSEIGAGISASLVRIVSDKIMLSARAERWRGTRTTIMQSLEVAFGIHYAL